MTDHERAVAAARARADQEMQQTNAVIDALVNQVAAELSRGEDSTDVWASLATRLQDSDQPLERQRDFAVQALAAAVLRLAERENDQGG